MSTQTRQPLPARLHSLAAMAGLLERMEQAPTSPTAASAEQYRGVVQQVSRLLAEAEPDHHLHTLLNAAPHTAQLYENLRFERAGLCRAPLETAMNAERVATAALAAAREKR